MADLSFSFDPAQIEVNKSAASDAASAAAAASQAASAASVTAAAASNTASAASVAVATLDGTVVKSIPGIGSRAVHEIMRTSAGLIKYVYSSVAQA